MPRKKHGNKIRTTTTVSPQDAETIERSRYTYADAIRHFARILRERHKILTEDELEQLREEKDNLLIRLTELEVEIGKTQRKLKKINEQIRACEEALEDQEFIMDESLKHAVKFVEVRVEEWRRRGHDVTPETLTNDNGETIIEVASRVYGVPVDEIREALKRVGGDL